MRNKSNILIDMIRPAQFTRDIDMHNRYQEIADETTGKITKCYISSDSGLDEDSLKKAFSIHSQLKNNLPDHIQEFCCKCKGLYFNVGYITSMGFRSFNYIG